MASIPILSPPIAATTAASATVNNQPSCPPLSTFFFKSHRRLTRLHVSSPTNNPRTAATPTTSSASGETIFFDGGAHYGDLVANLVLGFTLFWLPLTLAAVSRAMYLRYRFSNLRVTVISGLTGEDRSDFGYSVIKDVQVVPRFIGEWGDVIITLKDGTKVDLRSVPKFRDIAKYCLAMAQKSQVLKETEPKGFCCPSLLFNPPPPQSQNTTTKPRNSSSECRHSFVATTASYIFPNTKFTNHESLPSLHESFSEFKKVYPKYSDTDQVDHVRAKEYYHLSFSNQSCLDYIGIGLFSYYQRQHHRDTSKTQLASSSTPQSPTQYSDIPFFSISYKTGNLKTLLLHGGQESEFESAMKRRIMKFLNISENDYFMVFTANRTSAFKLVADSYPFQSSKKLLTVYDYESEAVEAMISCSEKRGAKAMAAEFSWSRLRIQSTKLRKMIVSKRKKKKKRGLFVFPLHSRVTGARYPYLWMSVAQENGWHVLIDACALGPKDMDSFGLSLFQPDFLICSFYKVFGENPSGFGCLFVKKSAITALESSSCGGIVNLVPDRFLHQSSQDKGSSGNCKQKPLSSLQDQELSSLNSFSGRIQTSQALKVEEEESSELQIMVAPAEPKEGSGSVEAKELVERLQNMKARDGESEGFNIECRCLDQVDSLGLIVITNRTRYLINWLVNSMMKLKHPNAAGEPLVKIYGPKVKFDRGPALAFNVFDWKGEKVEPVLVQKLADRNNISLSYGFLHHIWSGYKQTKWSHVNFEHPSTFQTLAMDPKKKEEIVDDLDRFKAGKEYYAKVGKAWKRGYLLYGPPGTGKSSMIAAMANYMNYDVYDLELTAVKENTDLRKLLIETSSKSIIVIEDIDCSIDLTGQRKKKKEKDEDEEKPKNPEKKAEEEEKKGSKVTLSGLLNFIDGIWSACGGERIIIFTTNFVDKLDPALIRRGRMDKHIEMSYCGYEAFKVLAKNYLGVESHTLFPTIEKLLGETNMPPADVAENLMPKSIVADSELCLKSLIESLEEAKKKAEEEAEKKAKEDEEARLKEELAKEEKVEANGKSGEEVKENGSVH